MTMNLGAILMAVLAILAVIHTNGVDAKRGCASFGHACYGGMGKRNDELPGSNEELLQEVPQDENPEFVFTGPRSGANSQLRRPNQDEIREQIYKLSPFLRQWLRSYRNADLSSRK